MNEKSTPRPFDTIPLDYSRPFLNQFSGSLRPKNNRLDNLYNSELAFTSIVDNNQTNIYYYDRVEEA